MNWWWWAYRNIVQVWRWRRVCRRGVVLANRRREHRPAPEGVAYTWRGACVGNATRDQLADALATDWPGRAAACLSPEFLAQLRDAYGPPATPTRRAR